MFGQGSLTPPGAPTPTMKSLDQVEARTPVGIDATIAFSRYATGSPGIPGQRYFSGSGP